MILTEEHFNAAKSVNGGWSQKQVRLLGEKTFHNKGWKKRCTGKDFPEEIIAQFIALKDSHFKNQEIISKPTKHPKSQNNAKKLARQIVFSYVVNTLNHRRNGLKLVSAIKIFAKHKGLKIKGSPREWLYKLAIGGELPVVSVLSPKKKKSKKHENESQLDKLARNLKNKSRDYQVFLKSKYWREVRKLVFVRDGKICRICKAEKNLEVHHDTYKNHFNEHNHLEDLMVLCRTCHQDFHDNLDTRRKL